MIYSNNIQVLNEKTETEVKLSVAIERFKKWFLGQEMDTKKINKIIHDIEDCNSKIEAYRKNPKKNNEIKDDKLYAQKMTKECLWVYPASGAIVLATLSHSFFAPIINCMYVFLCASRLDRNVFLYKLETENNKALKWLKEEKETINNGKKTEKKENENEENISEFVTLYGQDADDFLESFGICIYDDHITINEEAIPGVEGEELLEEHGIFLYEDGIVLEGQQAEEYKARKAKEAEDEKMAENKRYNKRYLSPAGTDPRKKEDPNMHKAGLKVADEIEKDKDFVKKYVNIQKCRFNTTYRDAVDAGYRHQRRHPEQYKNESFIESIKII